MAVVAPGWLGDSVMALPAVRALRGRGAAEVVVLTKTGLVPLWRLCPDAQEVLPLPLGPTGTLTAAAALRRRRVEAAFVLPRSFRSALVPFLAGVRRRVGLPGHWRDWMLTAVVREAGTGRPVHQAQEYLRLVGAAATTGAAVEPRLAVGPAPQAQAARLLAEAGLGGRPLVAILPGAARGPSKRWPGDRFADVGRRVAQPRGWGVVVLGAAAEAGLCEAVARAAGPMAASLAGRTALEQLAGVLSLTRLAIGNDSGGIHLAAALGVPVVAVFGLTDPVRTAPLGHRQRVVTAEGVTGNRNVAARSRAARRALESIPVEAVHRAACDCLDEPPRTGEGPSNA